VGVLRRYGYWQPEREGYGARSEGMVTKSLDKPLEWATGFFFGNVKLSLELWQDMGISAQGDGDAGMAQGFADLLVNLLG
jgi:hypothetical protein